jgi:SAM-dependent methyltransferase
VNKTDRQGYNELYRGRDSDLISCSDAVTYVTAFEQTRIAPFHKGGGTKGYVRGLATQRMLDAAASTGRAARDITVLDGGCGQGELSVYLACKGFKVIGIDISEEACERSSHLAQQIGVDNVRFEATSLESTGLENECVDFVIGHASLHHFIKYEGVADELRRVLKPGGEMFFADSFGENKAYHLFHNKEEMERLGDVILTKSLIEGFFGGLHVTIYPTDWFVMLDKLVLKLLPYSRQPMARALSRVWWHLDRWMPKSRASLYLAGAVMTHVEKRS